jgi:hypothetical protein
VHYSNNDDSPDKPADPLPSRAARVQASTLPRPEVEDDGAVEEDMDVSIRDIHDAGYAFGGDTNQNSDRNSARAGSGLRHEITVGCRNLPVDSKKKKPNPLVAVFEKVEGMWYKVSQSRCVKGSVNPNFLDGLVVSQFPGQSQELEFRVYNASSRQVGIGNLLGSVEVVYICN